MELELIPKKVTERKYYSMLSQIGCIVCMNEGFGFSEAQIHHIRHGAGMGQKSHWANAIPLCYTHHLGGGHGVALHSGQKTFEERFVTEEKLLDMTKAIIKGIFHYEYTKDSPSM